MFVISNRFLDSSLSLYQTIQKKIKLKQQIKFRLIAAVLYNINRAVWVLFPN